MSNSQANLAQEAQERTNSNGYLESISKCYDANQQITGSGVHGAIQGKVRDRIDINSHLVALVTTDRQSGFDRQLALVPFKGAVLNLTSGFWFEQTKEIIPNHVVDIPHPYITISRKCIPFPIEFVVR
jgi:phosphoribosylaminoimidazole-succinocarboxamide synthase